MSYLIKQRAGRVIWLPVVPRLRTGLFGLAVLLLGLAPSARADIIIDFETEPSLPQQPNNFAAAGAMQTYSKAGVYSISGGVVLGDPLGLPAFVGNGGTFGSAPNLYGTTDFGDPSLQATIKLALPAAENITQVGFVLFNGQNNPEDYHVRGVAGGSSFDFDLGTLAGAANPSASVTIVTITSGVGPITEMDFFTPNSMVNGWDFFVDDIKIHGNAALAGVPEPSSIVLLTVMGGLVTLSYMRRRRKDGLPEAGAAS